MSKAFNLALLANNVNSAGLLDGGAVNGPVANATDAVNADNADNATNATNATNLVTASFSIVESGGKLVIKYGATTIVSISSTGEIIATDNVTAYGTP